MPADISGFKDKIARIRQALEQNEARIATELSLATKALANRNAVERGIGENYSNNEIPVFFFNQSTINQGGKDYIKKQGKSKKKGGGDGLGNWKGLRAAEGLQTGFVDLTHSGQMWRGIEPQAPVKQGSVTTAPLGGTTREVQQEMNYNFQRYGDFIQKSLTAENRETLNQFVGDSINDVIKSVT